MPIPYAPPVYPRRAWTRPVGSQLGPVTADLGPIPWNRVDSDGVEWHLTGLDGWWDSPDLRAATVERPAGHGAWTGPGFFEARSITLTGLVLAPTPAVRDTALARLAQACPLTPTGVLRVDGDPATQVLIRRGGPLRVAKPTRVLAQVQVQLYAPDPRRYLADPETAALVLPASPAGISAPLTTPLVLPAPGSLGAVAVAQPGDLDAPWTALIRGPVTNPAVINLDTGQALRLDLTIADGQTLWLDARDGSVAWSGVDTSAVAAGSGWWLIPSGGATVGFTGAGAPPAACQFTAYPCWS